MDAKQISILFSTLGISPNYIGYRYLVHVVLLAVSYSGQTFPQLKDLYAETAEYFDVSVGIVMHDIRTVLRTYWNRNDTDTFTKVTGYPVSDTLTIKEFVSIVAEYLVTHF